MLARVALSVLATAGAAGAFQAPGCVPTARPRAAMSLRMQQQPAPSTVAFSRREFFKTSGAAFLTVGALGFEVPASFAEGLPKAGAVAPSFDLPSNRGKNFSNKDLLGKWAVMYFYPGDFTSGCTIEAKNFQANADALRAAGAEIYGVSVDSLDKHLDFAKQYDLSFALLSDKDGKVSDAYGSALKIPFMGTFSNRQTYLIDPEGNLRWVFTDVEKRVKKHAEEVLAKLQELNV